MKQSYDVINSGELNKYIIIQQQSVTRDTDGSELITWSDLVSCWAGFKYRTGKENFVADQEFVTIDLEITIRHRADITPKMRVKYGVHYYNVEAMEDVKMTHKKLILFCVEEGAAID